MPNYSKLRELVSHRVTIEYDTGARIVGYLAACQPKDGPVQLVRLQKAEVTDATGAVMPADSDLWICPNVLTGFHLEEGPSGRDV